MKKSIAWAFPKKSPYLNIFNFYFQEFKERGIWGNIEEKYKTLTQVCPDLSGKPIDFQSCFTAFLAMFVGLSLSALIIMIEFHQSKFNKAVLNPVKLI